MIANACTPTSEPYCALLVRDLDQIMSRLNDQNVIFKAKLNGCLGAKPEPDRTSKENPISESCAVEAIRNRINILNDMCDRYEENNRRLSEFV